MRHKKRGAEREGQVPAPQLGRLYINRSIKAPKSSASGGATSDSTKKGQVTPQFWETVSVGKRGRRIAAQYSPKATARQLHGGCCVTHAGGASQRAAQGAARPAVDSARRSADHLSGQTAVAEHATQREPKTAPICQLAAPSILHAARRCLATDI